MDFNEFQSLFPEQEQKNLTDKYHIYQDFILHLDQTKQPDWKFLEEIGFSKFIVSRLRHHYQIFSNKGDKENALDKTIDQLFQRFNNKIKYQQNLIVLTKIISNLIKEPQFEKYRTLNQLNQKLKELLFTYEEIVKILELVGFQNNIEAQVFYIKEEDIVQTTMIRLLSKINEFLSSDQKPMKIEYFDKEYYEEVLQEINNLKLFRKEISEKFQIHPQVYEIDKSQNFPKLKIDNEQEYLYKKFYDKIHIFEKEYDKILQENAQLRKEWQEFNLQLLPIPIHLRISIGQQDYIVKLDSHKGLKELFKIFEKIVNTPKENFYFIIPPFNKSKITLDTKKSFRDLNLFPQGKLNLIFKK